MLRPSLSGGSWLASHTPEPDMMAKHMCILLLLLQQQHVWHGGLVPQYASLHGDLDNIETTNCCWWTHPVQQVVFSLVSRRPCKLHKSKVGSSSRARRLVRGVAVVFQQVKLQAALTQDEANASSILAWRSASCLPCLSTGETSKQFHNPLQSNCCWLQHHGTIKSMSCAWTCMHKHVCSNYSGSCDHHWPYPRSWVAFFDITYMCLGLCCWKYVGRRRRRRRQRRRRWWR